MDPAPFADKPPRYTTVEITVPQEGGKHYSFETTAPEGMSLGTWQAKVTAAYGADASVRPVDPDTVSVTI